MSDKDYFSIYHKATKFAEKAEFQESLNLMNDVFLFHDEGGLAYKYYFHALMETDPDARMKDLERARSGFKSLMASVDENLDKKGMDEVQKRMLDHIEGLEGSVRSTREENGNGKK